MSSSNGKHIEPLLWSLFGAGGMTIAYLMPAVILIVGMLVPLGIIPAEALSYERMSAFVTESWIGRLFIIALLVPSYWGCIHRVYHGMHDLQIHAGKSVKVACYGGTLLLSILTVMLVF